MPKSVEKELKETVILLITGKELNSEMAVPLPKESREKLSLHEDADGDADTSLIHSSRSGHDSNRNSYYSDPVFGGMNDNPYRDTTESDCSSLRHMPLSEVCLP